MRYTDYIAKNRQFKYLGLGKLEFYSHCSILGIKDFETYQKMVRCGLLRPNSTIFKMTDYRQHSLFLSPLLLQFIETNASHFLEAFKQVFECVAGYNNEAQRLNNPKTMWQYEVRLGDKIFHLDVIFVLHKDKPLLSALMYYTGHRLYSDEIINTLEFPLSEFMQFLSDPIHTNLYTPYLFDQYNFIKSKEPFTKVVHCSIGEIQNDICKQFFKNNIVRRVCKH